MPTVGDGKVGHFTHVRIPYHPAKTHKWLIGKNGATAVIAPERDAAFGVAKQASGRHRVAIGVAEPTGVRRDDCL
jgi:hypothetical protein